MRQIDPSNVLGIRRFAEIHDCMLLEKYARKYAAHNMEAVLQQSEEFVQLSRSELRQLIKMTDLNVSFVFIIVCNVYTMQNQY